MTGSCLMSKSLLKLLVCAAFELKAQPDTLAHWSLIDVSGLTQYYQRSNMEEVCKNDGAQGLNEELGLHDSGPLHSCSY